MKTLNVNLKSRSYQIHISANDWDHSARTLKTLLKENRVFILTNPKIKTLYQKTLQKAFDPHFECIWISIPDGEKHKNLATCEKILTTLSQKGATRQSCLLALGGGVVGDITGFVAAIYMRGIDFVQVPTTLLAQVDSSVGGKTGVDLATGKNLVGAFYQPKAVFVHTDFLKTLPKREYLCGMAEVIKYGVIFDAKFFKFLEKSKNLILKHDAQALENIIMRSCAIKSKVVGLDETENSIRAILNYGHTLGHAIEVLTGFDKIKHGEAVAIGMVFAAKVAVHLKAASESLPEMIMSLLKAYGLPTQWPKLSPQKYALVMQKDKKATSRNIKFILPEKIGKVRIVSLTTKEITSCL